jgi:hypothetical protein
MDTLAVLCRALLVPTGQNNAKRADAVVRVLEKQIEH